MVECPCGGPGRRSRVVTTASNAALLLNLEGLATMAIAWLVCREKVDRRRPGCDRHAQGARPRGDQHHARRVCRASLPALPTFLAAASVGLFGIGVSPVLFILALATAAQLARGPIIRTRAAG